MKTWHGEMAVAGLALGSVAWWQGRPADWLGALAVLLSFGHATVAERMRERQAIKQLVDVECHRMLTQYLIAKETAWVVFFTLSGSYPALMGCGIFILYPLWRKLWRRRHPLDTSVLQQSGKPNSP